MRNGYVLSGPVILCLLALSVFALTAALPASAQAQFWTGNANFFAGIKALDEDDWEPADQQLEVGIRTDFRPETWPVSIAVDLMFGSDKDRTRIGGRPVDLESETMEIDLGVRKTFIAGPIFRPFVGGGLAYIGAEATTRSRFFRSTNSSGDGAGFWLGVGGYFTIARHYNVGLELRYSNAEVDLDGVDVDAGGTHFGWFAGFHW